MKNKLNQRAQNLDLTLEQKRRIDDIRIKFSDLYDTFDEYFASSKRDEVKQAYTNLEQAQMWAIKSISRINI